MQLQRLHEAQSQKRAASARSGCRPLAQGLRHVHHASGCCRDTTVTVAKAVATREVAVQQHEWSDQAFPTYLQSLTSYDPLSSSSSGSNASLSYDGCDGYQYLWKAIRREAKREAAFEPLLSSFLHASILGHDSFERALAFVLSARLANAILLPSQLFGTFLEVLLTQPDVRDGALADIEACTQRDPACLSPSMALLHYKGYHSLQTHRISHALYMQGHTVMALALQNRLSEALGVDIHPAAKIGHGVFMDHACGVVIGETAVIGNNVTIMQRVTLGGTGKETGDRHPKIADNVLIGACTTVLGNIHIGEGALIAPGSLVLKAVPANAMVAGSPAQQVGERQMQLLAAR
uniref:serine O-acetyltransferase n=1 Tax=Tetradesmus obliquus TaxID=3088 RepID=A0A383V634_TETOB|eukprot:jgi/Sobl393_1/1323/SZX59796.1